MQRAIGGEDARFDVIIHPAATALVIAHRSARLSRLEPRAEDVVRGSECTSRCVSPRFERGYTSVKRKSRKEGAARLFG
jgi:hypothetical protein